MRNLIAVIAALTLGFSAAALADDGPAAGSFLVVTGDVKVVRADGSARAAQRGGEFRQGESIVTGPDSLAQLRMTDGAAISVRAGSHLRLDQYRFRGSDDPEPSFLASLVKGGFRTITGWIGRKRESYRVATTSATLGIRGTHFEIVHVEQPLPDAAPGTYNRVYEGITTFRNRAGTEILVSREQTAFVALPGNLAPVLVTPPVGIFGKPTPVPTLKPQASGDTDDKAGAPRAREALRAAPKASESVSTKAGAPVRGPVESLNSTVSPALTAPATSIAPQTGTPLLNPLDTPATISPTLTAPTTTISPTLTTPTTTISPTLTTPTTTISPTLTAPTTTISPTLTAPTTTISPTLTAPTTTISPTLTAPTTTISPTLTAPTTSTINTIKR